MPMEVEPGFSWQPGKVTWNGPREVVLFGGVYWKGDGDAPQTPTAYWNITGTLDDGGSISWRDPEPADEPDFSRYAAERTKLEAEHGLGTNVRLNYSRFDSGFAGGVTMAGPANGWFVALIDGEVFRYSLGSDTDTGYVLTSVSGGAWDLVRVE